MDASFQINHFSVKSFFIIESRSVSLMTIKRRITSFACKAKFFEDKLRTCLVSLWWRPRVTVWRRPSRAWVQFTTGWRSNSFGCTWNFLNSIFSPKMSQFARFFSLIKLTSLEFLLVLNIWQNRRLIKEPKKRKLLPRFKTAWVSVRQILFPQKKS